jgi:DNA-binding response OmpR family regulator
MTTETTKNNVKKKRILIVDDEPDVSMVLRKVFEQSGFNTDSYDDPVLALENYNAGYDLVLLDIKMPEMDGFHLYKEMKKIDNNVKVCFLTAGEIYCGKEGDFCADKDLFIRKPIENEDLIKKINTIISS